MADVKDQAGACRSFPGPMLGIDTRRRRSVANLLTRDDHLHSRQNTLQYVLTATDVEPFGPLAQSFKNPIGINRGQLLTHTIDPLAKFNLRPDWDKSIILKK